MGKRARPAEQEAHDATPNPATPARLGSTAVWLPRIRDALRAVRGDCAAGIAPEMEQANSRNVVSALASPAVARRDRIYGTRLSCQLGAPIGSAHLGRPGGW